MNIRIIYKVPSRVGLVTGQSESSNKCYLSLTVFGSIVLNVRHFQTHFSTYIFFSALEEIQRITWVFRIDFSQPSKILLFFMSTCCKSRDGFTIFIFAFSSEITATNYSGAWKTCKTLSYIFRMLILRVFS